MPEGNEKDLYFVAVKLLLRDGDQLLITHDIFGDWDLPGGRIRSNEFDKPLEVVIDRKVREELGQTLQYQLGKPITFFRVQRKEQSLGKNVRIFAVGYETTLLEGEPELGDHHDQLEWVNVYTFKPEKYLTGGWLTGMQEYLSIVRDS